MAGRAPWSVIVVKRKLHLRTPHFKYVCFRHDWPTTSPAIKNGEPEAKNDLADIRLTSADCFANTKYASLCAVKAGSSTKKKRSGRGKG